MSKHPEPLPGEWQEEVNPFGGVRRYRMIGKIKEYEKTIRINGMEIPESELEDFNRRRREAEEARRKAPLPPPAQKCPFNATGLPTDCKQGKCALYDGEACSLAQIAPEAARDTAGIKCPFNPYQCDNKCSLYKSGCVLTNVNPRKRGNKNG